MGNPGYSLLHMYILYKQYTLFIWMHSQMSKSLISNIYSFHATVRTHSSLVIIVLTPLGELSADSVPLRAIDLVCLGIDMGLYRADDLRGGFCRRSGRL